ncbi:MAG: DUF1223 domain-containing protein [Phycisphaerales bacterium]|nr:DUF1223 domain-containing protein [Phycisphaerales bacterium]
MNKLFVAILLSNFIVCTTYANAQTTTIGYSYHPLNIIEYFTSQGCSSCPPADKVLANICAQDKTTFLLSYHVTYWNYLGWTDPFSLPNCNERQLTYVNKFSLESAYTPQVVINGEAQQVGNNQTAIEDILDDENTDFRPLIKDVDIQIDRNKNTVVFSPILVPKTISNAWIISYFIIDKIDTTLVSSGENASKKLIEMNVIRNFGIDSSENFNAYQLDFFENNTNNTYYALLIQDKNTLHILDAWVGVPRM